MLMHSFFAVEILILLSVWYIMVYILQQEERIMLIHPIPPLFDKSSKILILGSFPSVKSRETQFFYGHPQNRFWLVVSDILEESCPKTVAEKRELLLKHNIAVWDVIKSCDIAGSSDSSIKNVVPNDLSVILNNAEIGRIFVNGRTAYKYFCKFNSELNAECLPSTSPANAAFSIEKLVGKWSVIKEYL